MSKVKRNQTVKRGEKERLERKALGESPFAQLMVGTLQRFAPYLDLMHQEPAAAAVQVRERLKLAVEQIVAATDDVDAFDMLDIIKFTSSLGDPETFREGERATTLLAIELLAVILAARGHRAASSGGEDAPPQPGVVMEVLQRNLGEIIDAGQVLAMLSFDRKDSLHRISFGARLREIAMRNSAYPHMENDTLVGLFDDPALEQACRSALGCSVAEIRQVFAALQQASSDGWADGLDAMAELADLMDAAAGFTPELVERGQEVLDRTFLSPAARQAAVYRSEEVAPNVGLPVETVSAVFKLFATPLRTRSEVEAVLEFLEGKTPFRTRPLLGTEDGEYAAVHHALLTPAIRDRVEEALQLDQRAWDLYSKHRGAYLENEAVELIAAHLPGCARHVGFEYFIPAKDTETAPSLYTKVAEGDGLLILGDLAVIIEAKAVALRPRSRTGDPLRLRDDLRKIVSAAADQGDRLRQRIMIDRGLRLRDGSWLDLGEVREVHTIAVSLQDLSGIATITSELVLNDLLTTDDLPWTVSLHDLRVISELIEHPAELLLYLRRRTEPETTRLFHAVDELDFFLHFLNGRFYVEPDPDEVHRELPTLGSPRTRDRRRHREQQLELLTSLTEPLDSWYFYRLGLRTTPAEKPSMKCNPKLRELIDLLQERKEPGWLAMSATLLHLDTAGQHRSANAGADLAAMTREDHHTHSLAMPAGRRRGDSAVFVWCTTVPTLPLASARKSLAEYASAKKHQLQLDRALGFLYDHNGQLIHTYYDNRPPGPDQALDGLVSKLGLQVRGPSFVSDLASPRMKSQREKHGRRKR